MSSIATVYSNAVKKHFKTFFTNWEPGVPLALGDYGYLEDNIFIPIGKITDDYPEIGDTFLKFTFNPSKNHEEFKSGSGIEVKLEPGVSMSVKGVALAKAVLNINFSSENQVYFNAIGCKTTRITNKAMLGYSLEPLMTEGRWKKEFCVVTDLVEADKVLIAISNSNSSGI